MTDYQELDRLFDDAPVNSNEPIPPGKYEAVVTKVVLDHNRWGNEELQLECTVTKGPHKGRKLWPAATVDDPNRLGFLKSMLAGCGLDPLPKPSQLVDPDVRESILGRLLKVAAVARGDSGQYRAYYVNGFLGFYQPTEDEDDDDELPF